MAKSYVWRDICSTYDQAQEKGASMFTETNTEIYQDGSFNYILKIARNLRDKPKAKKSNTGEWKNPFLPPDEDLFVCRLSGTHSLVLNKFNITPHHVIIITNEFVEQEQPLTLQDMAATWQVVQGMPGQGGMAFFNCGSLSGASQPHKHIQCVPLPLAYTADSVPVDPPFESVIREGLLHTSSEDGRHVKEIDRLPFAHGIVAIDATHAHVEEEIHDAYTLLLADLTRRLDEWDAAKDSYNLILTQKYIMIAPRRRESIESVSCNSMGFAGSFFLARQDEIEEMKRLGPSYVLSQLGYSRHNKCTKT